MLGYPILRQTQMILWNSMGSGSSGTWFLRIWNWNYWMSFTGLDWNNDQFHLPFIHSHYSHYFMHCDIYIFDITMTYIYIILLWHIYILYIYYAMTLCIIVYYVFSWNGNGRLDHRGPRIFGRSVSSPAADRWDWTEPSPGAAGDDQNLQRGIVHKH